MKLDNFLWINGLVVKSSLNDQAHPREYIMTEAYVFFSGELECHIRIPFSFYNDAIQTIQLRM